MTPFSSYTADGFQAGVQRLLPAGRAWPRRLGSTLAGLAGGIGDSLYQLHAQMVLLLDTESDPAQAVQLLPDFETDYGLPDPCTPPSASIGQRHAALLAKIAGLGGQSKAYFIGVAAALGYTVTITTWDAWTPWDSPWLPITGTPWRFAWQVNAPAVTVSYFTGYSSPWDPLWTISDTMLECRLRALAPAYGDLWFLYG